MIKMKQHNQIFLFLAFGVVVGLFIPYTEDFFIQNNIHYVYEAMPHVTHFIGVTLFIGLLKMIIAPLILLSIVSGITTLKNFDEVKTIGKSTVFYYFSTTAIAVLIGLCAVLTIKPGTRGYSNEIRAQREAQIESYRQEFVAQGGKADNRIEFLKFIGQKEGVSQTEKYNRIIAKKERSPFEMVTEDVIKPMITNPFNALANNNSLGIIFFSILLALGLAAYATQTQPMIDVFHAGNAAIMKITHWLMGISPYAIFCLMVNSMLQYGPEVFQTLGWYCLTVLIGIACHVLFLLAVVWIFGRKNPINFIIGLKEALLISFSTRSSAATLPVTIRCLTTNLGISKKVVGFTTPVGATINMDGTALYEGIAILFLFQVFGGLEDVPTVITGTTIFIIFITAVLASIGAAAVPDSGLITMVLVATAVGLPVYYIPFIFAVDAFLDMFRTSTNVLGDSVGAAVVARYVNE